MYKRDLSCRHLHRCKFQGSFETMADFSPGFVKNYCPCRRKLVKDVLGRHRKHKLSKIDLKNLISSQLKTSFSKNTAEKIKRN